MADPDIALEECSGQDWETLLGFTRAFCAEDGHPHGPENEAALGLLAGNSEYGRVLLIRHRGIPAGYAVLCYGFSLEFHGRDAFIDEIYVDPAHRGVGIGTLVLDRLQRIAAADGVRALHLEVMDGNEGAARLYRRKGWEQRDSRLMTKPLVAG